MHHALRIEETLLNIFDYCDPATTLGRFYGSRGGADLTALARTCRAFKDPALDVLWSVLRDLTPLVRCLPEISREVISFLFLFTVPVGSELLCFLATHQSSGYGFTRPLKPAELDILRGYARRIQCLNNFNRSLDWESIGACVNIPPTEPLFANLLSIHRCFFFQEAAPWLSLPFPSLRFLIIYPFNPEDFHTFQVLFESFAKSSPNIDWVSIDEFEPDFPISKQVSDQICCWSNLQVLNCCSVVLDMDALGHLSSMPNLRELGFRPDSATHPDPAVVLSFPNLDRLRLLSTHLAPISRILSCLRLSLLTVFNAWFSSTPSRQELSAFLTSVETCGMGHMIQDWELSQMSPYDWESDSDTDESDLHSGHILLGLHDLYPHMAFTDLRHMQLNIRWAIGLTDQDLLALGQAWPKLSSLDINQEWGWRHRGITPHGLAQFLQRYPSVALLRLAIDTHGFTALPPSLARSSSDSESCLRVPPRTAACRIDVLDSAIEDASVPAMAALFAAVVPHGNFGLTTWDDHGREADLDRGVYSERWTRVYARANEVVEAGRLERVDDGSS